MNARRASRGFSLIELTIVVVIIGVVVAVAVPRFANSLGTQRANAAARLVAADVQRAVNLARNSSSPVTIVFDADAGTYRVAGMILSDRAGGSDSRSLSDEFPGISLALCDFDGSSTLTIDGYGTPETSGTIVLKKNDEIRTLVFDKATGRVEIVNGIPGMVGAGGSGPVILSTGGNDDE